MSMIRNELELSKIWKIAALVLYDDEATEIIRREFLEVSVDISTDLVSNFIQTLEEFSRTQFNERVYEIVLGRYRLLFEEYHNYILVAITEPGAAVDTGKEAPMSKTTRHLLNLVADVLGPEKPDKLLLQNINLQFIDDMVETINSNSNNPDSVFHNIQNFERTEKFNVSSVLVTDHYSKPYVFRSYEDGIY